jgi:hypothetical protein
MLAQITASAGEFTKAIDALRAVPDAAVGSAPARAATLVAGSRHSFPFSLCP